MKIGELFWVNLDPTVGDEIQKRRPVLVLNGGHEKNLKLAIVVPVTSYAAAWEHNPFFVPIDPSEQNGLKKKSVIDCFQIRAISHNRFGEKIGGIDAGSMDLVKTAVALILDMEPHHCTY